MVVHAGNSRVWEAKARGSFEFKASLNSISETLRGERQRERGRLIHTHFFMNMMLSTNRINGE